MEKHIIMEKYNSIFVLYFSIGSGLNNPERISGRCKYSYLSLLHYIIDFLRLRPHTSPVRTTQRKFWPDIQRLSYAVPPNLMLRT